MITWVVFSPLFAGIVLALALWLGWHRWPHWLRPAGLAGLLACYLLMTPLVAEPLIGTLESGAQTPCEATPAAIVVLSGGADAKAPSGYFAALNLASLRRLLGAVQLWRRQGANTPLILVGGSGQGDGAESTRMAALAQRLGVPASLIRSEIRSRTTWENAEFTARLKPPVPHTVWLVTSAVHMRRARYAMQRAGFAVCTAAVDYRRQPLLWTTALLPSSDALSKTDAALHELIGLAWYHLK